MHIIVKTILEEVYDARSAEVHVSASIAVVIGLLIVVVDILTLCLFLLLFDLICIIYHHTTKTRGKKVVRSDGWPSFSFEHS